MSRKQKPLSLSRFQAGYLVELVRDDLELTELSWDEQRAAEGLLGRLEVIIDRYDNPENYVEQSEAS